MEDIANRIQGDGGDMKMDSSGAGEKAGRMENIPEKIAQLLPEGGGIADGIGESSACVRIFPDRVLKIQPEGEEAENELRMSVWLSEKLKRMPAFKTEA